MCEAERSQAGTWDTQYCEKECMFNSTFCFWDYHIITTFLHSLFPLSHFNKTRNFSKQLLWKDCLGAVQSNFSLLSLLETAFLIFGSVWIPIWIWGCNISSWDSYHTELIKINKPIQPGTEDRPPEHLRQGKEV